MKTVFLTLHTCSLVSLGFYSSFSFPGPVPELQLQSEGRHALPGSLLLLSQLRPFFPLLNVINYLQPLVYSANEHWYYTKYLGQSEKIKFFTHTKPKGDSFRAAMMGNSHYKTLRISHKRCLLFPFKCSENHHSNPFPYRFITYMTLPKPRR